MFARHAVTRISSNVTKITFYSDFAATTKIVDPINTFTRLTARITCTLVNIDLTVNPSETFETITKISVQPVNTTPSETRVILAVIDINVTIFSSVQGGFSKMLQKCSKMAQIG